MYCIALYSHVQYCIVFLCTVLYCTISLCIVLYCSALYCIVSSEIARFFTNHKWMVPRELVITPYISPVLILRQLKNLLHLANNTYKELLNMIEIIQLNVSM